MARRKIIINGGGIAGLTAALFLSKGGNRVDIYEKAAKIDPLGAGIQISPNAFHALNTLSLGNDLRLKADMPNSIFMMNAKTGKQLARLPLGFEIEDKYVAPYLVMHRSDLQNMLLEACNANPDITVHLGHEVVDAVSHQNGVTAIVKSSENVNESVADIMVSADGVHSRIRTDVLELPNAKHSGKTAWRALIPYNKISDNKLLNNTTVWLGPNAHAVTYPIRNKSYLNIIAVTNEEEATKNSDISPEKLKEKFKNWNEEFTDFFSSDARWTGWPIFEMSLPYDMVEGNIALIGDASHAMLPFAAQGAAQAIEDAYVLSKCILENDNSEEALLAFEKERLPRIRKLMKTAKSNGRIYHLTGLFATVRNLALSKLPGERLLNKQDWIYRWRR